MSSLSTADLLTVVFNTIVQAFNSCGVTQAVALDISKTFNSVWHAHLLLKLKSYEFHVKYLALFLLFSVIDSFKLFWM